MHTDKVWVVQPAKLVFMHRSVPLCSWPGTRLYEILQQWQPPFTLSFQKQARAQLLLLLVPEQVSAAVGKEQWCPQKRRWPGMAAPCSSPTAPFHGHHVLHAERPCPKEEISPYQHILVTGKKKQPRAL